MTDIEKAIKKWERIYKKYPKYRSDSWLEFLHKLKEKNLHIECSYGCEFYHYTCDGDPYGNPCCPSMVICNEKGDEVNVDG